MIKIKTSHDEGESSQARIESVQDRNKARQAPANLLWLSLMNLSMRR